MAEDGGRLMEMSGFIHEIVEEGVSFLEAVSFTFEDTGTVYLRVNPDEDSFLWECDAPQGRKKIELEILFPKVSTAYGLHVIWSWQMKNQQGYFDALQISLNGALSNNEIILQFLAIGSAIKLFEVTKM